MKYLRSATESMPGISRSLWRSLWVACLLAVLTACTGTPQIISGRAFHSLSFDPSRESEGIQALYYRYGSADQFGLRTTSDDLATGKPIAGAAITGELPVGDDFYVKWRIVATGQVLEDSVNLKSRLPFNMNRQTLKPIIEGTQLYIYLISFDPVRDVMTVDDADEIRRQHRTRREQAFSYVLRNKVIQIYPTRIEDPQLPAKFKK
jgi:hypothetical protein